MPAWCLTKENVLKFKQALRDRTIDPFKMAEMTSPQRRTFLEKFVGKENGLQVNSLFESKLLLKNQKAGYVTWAKRVSGITPQTKRDLLSRIERMENILNPEEEQAFLQDLATTRLGFGVTETEARVITEQSSKILSLKEQASAEGVFPTKDKRFEYGTANLVMENLINDLKLASKKVYFREQPLRKIAGAVGSLPGLFKSAVASLDDSFFGRQGIFSLLDLRTSHIWIKNFAKSFKDIGKEILGIDAMDTIKVDIFSRPNAVNGKYRAGGFGLDVLYEEAFPSHGLAKIPLLGRLYKASESAYNGGALRLRADLADRVITLAEKNKLNMLNPNDAKPIGNLISMITGRGGLGKGEVFAKETNVLFFSIKFLSANIGKLLAPGRYVAGKVGVLPFKSEGAKFASREAAKNTLSVVATVAAISTIAKTLDPSSVDLDHRSTNFGKVKVFGHWVDITGGMASVAVLASRLTPSVHNGKWGFWFKSGKGNYTDLMAGKYGQLTALDVAENFFEGKLSPAAGIVRDLWRNEVYGGESPTLSNLAKGATTPISIQNFEQFKKDPNTSSLLGTMILEGLGFSVGISSSAIDWKTSKGKQITAFKEAVSDTDFKNANNDFNAQYNTWLNLTKDTEEFKNLSDEGKKTLTENTKDKIQENVFKSYGFKYKTEKKKTTEESKTIKKLTPK